MGYYFQGTETLATPSPSALLSLSPPAKVLGTFSAAVRLAPFTILLISKAEKTGL